MEILGIRNLFGKKNQFHWENRNPSLFSNIKIYMKYNFLIKIGYIQIITYWLCIIPWGQYLLQIYLFR